MKLQIPFICFRFNAAEILQIRNHFECTQPQISAQEHAVAHLTDQLCPPTKKKNINDHMVSHTITFQNPHLHLVAKNICIIINK